MRALTHLASQRVYRLTCFSERALKESLMEKQRIMPAEGSAYKQNPIVSFFLSKRCGTKFKKRKVRECVELLTFKENFLY